MVVNPGVTITGQVTVPGITTFTGGTVTMESSSSGDFATATLASNGTFTVTDVPPGQDVVESRGVRRNRGELLLRACDDARQGENLALAPDLDYLDLYLLGPTGDPGTGTARLAAAATTAT